MFTPFCKIETRDHYVPATTPEFQANRIPLDGGQADGYLETCAITGSFERVSTIYNNVYCAKSVPYYGGDAFPNYWIKNHTTGDSSGYSDPQHFINSSDDRRYSAGPIATQYSYEPHCAQQVNGGDIELCQYSVGNGYQDATVVCGVNGCLYDGLETVVFNDSNNGAQCEAYRNRISDSGSRCSGEPEATNESSFFDEYGESRENSSLETEAGVTQHTSSGNNGILSTNEQY